MSAAGSRTPLLRLRLATRVAAMAAEAVWATRLRSLFVILGVACGIASLTLIVTSIDGANKKAHEIVEFFGPDAALVFGGNFQKRAVGMRTLTLSWEDARAIRQSLPGAYMVVPMRAKFGLTVKGEGNAVQDQLVVGATENYAQAWNWPLAEGRDISAEDVEAAARVTLIGDVPARELFGDASPVGRSVYIGDVPFRVIGRLSYRGVTSGGGHGLDDRLIVPLTTLTKRFNMDRKYFRALRVKFHDAEQMEAHAANLRGLLRHLHRLDPREDDDFTIITADEVLKFLSMFKGGLVAFLGLTAACTVLVGGFVLANLFSISVSERSEEIGLKKALGAPGGAILGQFLTEALLLTLIGGILGLVLGLALGQLLTGLDILVIEFSWKAFWLSLASAVGIGVVFGLKPARQAARLDPILALKGEG